MSHHLKGLLLTSVILAVVGCGDRKVQQPPPADLPKAGDTVITMQRTGCYGMCPSYSVTIRGDGTVEYRGEEYVKIAGDQRGQISHERINQLVSKILAVDFLDLENYSGSLRILDAPSVILSVTLGKRSNTIKVANAGSSHYDIDRNARPVVEVADLIDLWTNTEQWTGVEERQRRFDSLRAARPGSYRH